MDYTSIQVEQRGAIGVLTLNRPECLNAINHTLRDELRSYFRDRADDLTTRVVVITGAGKGFCAGLDVKDPEITGPGRPKNPQEAYQVQRTFSEMILSMRRCPQPIIGAINGAAVGAGFSLAMACDIRLATPNARFQAAYINLGFGGADMGSSWFLPRAVGLGNAALYLMTGDFLPAAEALRIGLVQSVVDPGDLLEQALQMARKLSYKSPLGLRVTKEALNCNAAGTSLEEAILLEDRNQALCIAQLVGAQTKSLAKNT